MAVYVDCARNAYGRMIMSHMWADTAEELHSMADRIGIARKWFQTPDGPNRASFPHYDICQKKRDRAIEAGAHIMQRREGSDCRRAIRAHMIDDPAFAASWRWDNGQLTKQGRMKCE